MTEDYTFVKEMSEIKGLLANISKAVGASKNAQDDILIMYPDTTTDMNLAASGKYERTLTTSKRLKSMCLSVPANCVLEIHRNNSVWAWFSDEYGTFDFNSGISFEEFKIKVTNYSTTSTARWTFKAVFV